jgi:predicted nucleic-acid-binding Zn-ribbon protein
MLGGTCPKCASEEVYYNDAKGSQSGLSTDGGQPLLRVYKDKRFMPDIALLEMNCYVCRACGYFEMYVQDVAQLSKLDDCTNWSRIKDFRNSPEQG